ncbi:MAG: helix-turn-helix domain-containing protein [Fimbriimonadaceae bacterium]|nr:helix-turn-helix domain-containing protein [Fimbriimonadaceae bacterium]
MNFADAIRKASADPHSGGIAGNPPVEHNIAPKPAAPKAKAVSEAPAPVEASFAAMPASGTEPHAPSPHVTSGNVVRLELFLSAEQMSGLFRAIMAGQHTVMTAREAAAYLRIGKETLTKLAEDGEIPGLLIEGRWRFPKPNLDEWLTMHSVHPEENEDVA